MKMNKDRISAAALLLLAVAFGIGATNISGIAAGDDQGPKLYPLGLSIVLALLSIILLIKGKGKGGTTLSFKALTKGFPPVIIMCFLYVILISKLGFVLCTITLLLALFWMKGERKWWLNLIVSISVSVGIYLLFATLLNVPLPMAPSFLKTLL